MRPVVRANHNGTLSIVDSDRHNTPIATLNIYPPLRDLAREQPELVANTILKAIVDAQRLERGKAA